MPESEGKVAGRVVYLLTAILAIAQGGCLLAIAGVAAGGAATGYMYYKGRIYRDYPASLAATQAAVHDALLDLRFPICTEESKDGKAFLVTKTTVGKKVRIYLEYLASPIPAEGTLVRVSIRVGAFGDEGVSARILDQVAWHLAHPPAIEPRPPLPGPGPIQQTPGVRPFETSPPPLAPPQPVKSK